MITALAILAGVSVAKFQHWLGKKAEFRKQQKIISKKTDEQILDYVYNYYQINEQTQ